MSQPTAYEQYMLELVNAERAAAGAQPLVFNDDLNDAADKHTDWMLSTDTFSHTGAGGSNPQERATAEGYDFTGNWSVGENIGWVSTGGPEGYADETQQLSQNLFNSPEHKANLLNPAFSEVGIGIDVGDYKGVNAAMVTEDFAKSGNAAYLTGVAYDDNGNKAYDVGEGLGGITVTATDAAGHHFTTTTMDAGGYKLALAPGDYTVTFSKGGTDLSSSHVTMADKNVDVDYVGGGGTGPAPSTADPAASASLDATKGAGTSAPASSADATPTTGASTADATKPGASTAPAAGTGDTGQSHAPATADASQADKADAGQSAPQQASDLSGSTFDFSKFASSHPAGSHTASDQGHLATAGDLGSLAHADALAPDLSGSWDGLAHAGQVHHDGLWA